MRTIKPEVCTSETLTTIPREMRWTFSCFWTHCDDEGRAVWNLRLIKASIYPLDDDVTLDVLEGEFQCLQAIGAVCRYEVNGRKFVHVPSFGEHQHPNRRVQSKLPPCPTHDHAPAAHTQRSEPTPATHTQRSEPAVSTHERLTPVVVVVDVDVDGDVGEKNSPAGKPAKRDPIPTQLRAPFAEFWIAYPRKIGKAEAARKFVTAARSTDPPILIAAAGRLAERVRRDGTEERFIPHPATWLHQGRWDDEPPQPRAPSQPQVTPW
jgi:hypothetical protein